jgi:hypothetical protein
MPTDKQLRLQVRLAATLSEQPLTHVASKFKPIRPDPKRLRGPLVAEREREDGPRAVGSSRYAPTCPIGAEGSGRTQDASLSPFYG